MTLDYAESVGVRVGAAYRFWRRADGEPRLAVRAGVGWDQAPTAPAATSPLLPDGDRTLVAAGVGVRLGLVSIDAGYLAAIASDLLGLSGSFGARYRSVTHTVSLALTLRLPRPAAATTAGPTKLSGRLRRLRRCDKISRPTCVTRAKGGCRGSTRCPTASTS